MKNFLGFISIILFSAGLTMGVATIIYPMATPVFNWSEFGIIVSVFVFCTSVFCAMNRKYTFI